MTRALMPSSRQQRRRLHGGSDRAARRDDGQVLAVDQRHALAELELVAFLVHALELLPRRAQERRPLVRHQRLDRPRRLEIVGRLDHRHRRQRSHQRDVLQAHLRVAVLADADARVAADHAHVGRRIADRHPDLVEARRHEAGERTAERHLARQRQARRDAQHVRLRDPHLEEALRELLGELLRPRALRQVGFQHDQLGVRLAQADQRVAERVARRDRRRARLDLHDGALRTPPRTLPSPRAARAPRPPAAPPSARRRASQSCLP